MDHKISFPHTPADITAEWLTEALRTTQPDIEVTQVKVLDQHTGTTGRMRVGLTYADGSDGPESMFVKLAPFEEKQQRLVSATDMGRREARFYADLRAETPMHAPLAYYAAYGEDRNEYVMLLEDLEAKGCGFNSRLQPQTEEHAAKLIEGFGHLHAHFWNDPRFDNELSWIEPPMRGHYGAKLIGSALDQFGDEFGKDFVALCRLYIDNDDAIVDLWDEGERTLVHGATHAGNHFVDGDKVGIYDWAVICQAPGIRDLAIYLGNSCEPELRRAEEHNLIKTYRETLIAGGVEDAPSEDVLFDRYRRTVLYSWVSATTTASQGDRWQPIEVGRTGMTRAFQACVDLDTFGALSELL